MPKRFPKEFRDDVVRVARSGNFTHEEIAHDFQVSASSPKRWLDQANVDNGLKDGLKTSEQDEIVHISSRQPTPGD